MDYLLLEEKKIVEDENKKVDNDDDEVFLEIDLLGDDEVFNGNVDEKYETFFIDLFGDDVLMLLNYKLG